MIIGNGDIGLALREIDSDDRTYFVSGVSNSREIRQSEFLREKGLLFEIKKAKHLVYVSSLAVYYLDTPYARHKRMMERLVKTLAHALRAESTIVRVGNITWGTNPNTLINYLRARKINGEPLEIQNTERYIIDKDEFLYWVKMIPDWSCEMNITGKRMSVAEIVERYVEPYCVLEAVA